MKTVIGIVLIIIAIVLAYLGITGLQESTAAVNFLGIELRAEDSGAKEIAIIQLVGAVIAFIGGVVLLRARNR